MDGSLDVDIAIEEVNVLSVVRCVAGGVIDVAGLDPREAGVTGSSSKCAGVSALTGLSLRIIRPSLPAIAKGSSDCASAAGIRPPGIR